jgi:hypothetical protein
METFSKKAPVSNPITPTLPHIDSLPARALARLLAGKSLSDSDLKSVIKAENLIDELEREVRL